MAGEVQRTQTAYIGAPTDGLNLVAPPNQMAPTEARQLDNYYTFDWGIRQRCTGELQHDFGSGSRPGMPMLIPFIRTDSGHVGEPSLLVSAKLKIWRFASQYDTTGTDLSGALVGSENYDHHIIFNDYIFIFNGIDLPIQYRISTGASVASASFTGTGLSIEKLQQPTTFKSRLYVTERQTTKFWYAGVEAIAGPMKSFDVAQVLQGGGTIAILTSWSFNQGIGSEEFLVVISTLGEVLVYSGDYPEATNWQLAGRTQIPTPIGTRAFVRVAQDVYINTMRGVLTLSRVFSGNTDDRYYIVSNKLGPHIQSYAFCDTRPGYSSDYPFLYFVGGLGKVLYVLNYERGAWSRFTYWNTIVPHPALPPEPPGPFIAIDSVAVAFGSLFIGLTTGQLHRFDDFKPAAVSGPDEYIWKTPFLGFDNGLVKSSKYIRVVAREQGIGSTLGSIAGTVLNTVSIATDFANTDPPGSGVGHANSDTAETPATLVPPTSLGPDWVVQELRPPGNGRTLSYVFARPGSGELNEISGFEVMTEQGGAY